MGRQAPHCSMNFQPRITPSASQCVRRRTDASGAVVETTLGKQLVYQLTVNVGQPKISALKTVDELEMIKAQQMK